MKLPTIRVGIPYGSRRMVKEKQQSMNPCSRVGESSRSLYDLPRVFAGVADPELGNIGLNRNSHDVSTAFWLLSKATCPYF